MSGTNFGERLTGTVPSDNLFIFPGSGSSGTKADTAAAEARSSGPRPHAGCRRERLEIPEAAATCAAVWDAAEHEPSAAEAADAESPGEDHDAAQPSGG